MPTVLVGFRGNTLSLVRWVILCVALTGCVTLPRTPFTQAEQASASPTGFGRVRYPAEEESLAGMLRQSLKPDAKGEINAWQSLEAAPTAHMVRVCFMAG